MSLFPTDPGWYHNLHHSRVPPLQSKLPRALHSSLRQAWAPTTWVCHSCCKTFCIILPSTGVENTIIRCTPQLYTLALPLYAGMRRNSHLSTSLAASRPLVCQCCLQARAGTYIRAMHKSWRWGWCGRALTLWQQDRHWALQIRYYLVTWIKVDLPNFSIF